MTLVFDFINRTVTKEPTMTDVTPTEEASQEAVAVEPPADPEPVFPSAPSDPAPGEEPAPDTLGEAVDANLPLADPRVKTTNVPTTVDASVTQGNRVVTQAQATPGNPVHELENKIRDHYEEAQKAVADVRAAADYLEQALNKLRVGIN